MRLLRIRFSIRTLLIGIAILAVITAIVGHRWMVVRTQRQIASFVVGTGGKISWDYEVGRDLSGPKWMRDMRANITQVEWSGVTRDLMVKPRDVQVLQQLPKLQAVIATE